MTEATIIKEKLAKHLKTYYFILQKLGLKGLGNFIEETRIRNAYFTVYNYRVTLYKSGGQGVLAIQRFTFRNQAGWPWSRFRLEFDETDVIKAMHCEFLMHQLTHLIDTAQSDEPIEVVAEQNYQEEALTLTKG